jgi:hypothetical protein
VCSSDIYLKNDEKLFKMANANLKKDGYLLVSFRNRLFNLFSISHRTINESKNGCLEKLISEANSYYKNIDIEKVKIFLNELQCACSAVLTSQDDFFTFSNSTDIPYSVDIEPRQSTPQDAETVATKYGFCAEKFVGVHPHFAVPGLNKLLPPMVYNKICDCFNVFEDEKIAMLWSSMFIGSFIKK